MVAQYKTAQRPNRLTERTGVSLIELTIATLITGILFAVASPIYSRSLIRFRTESAAQRIEQDILQAQQLARQTSSNRSIVFQRSSSAYRVTDASSLDRVSQPYQVNLTQHPYNVTISSLVSMAQPTTELSNLTLEFNRFGMPNQGVRIEIGTGGVRLRVAVAAESGRVTLE